MRSIHRVQRVGIGEVTEWRDGELTVSAREAQELLAAPCLAEVRVSWASPGDSARIVKVLDVVEPRAKGPGGGGVFPGWLDGKPSEGPTHVLRGAAVVVAGYLPRAQEAVIDMSGPAAELSPFGSTHNLVIESAGLRDQAGALPERSMRLGGSRHALSSPTCPCFIFQLTKTGDQSHGNQPR
jgi:sarcosine reductase